MVPPKPWESPPVASVWCRDPFSRSVWIYEAEKGLTAITTLGGPQEMAIVNESGLYSLILTSRKPEAKSFKKWVTSVILPSIRKTGKYEASRIAPAARHEAFVGGDLSSYHDGR